MALRVLYYLIVKLIKRLLSLSHHTLLNYLNAITVVLPANYGLTFVHNMRNNYRMIQQLIMNSN